MPNNEPRFFSSLEGIRGYAFLAVFLNHYYNYTTIPIATGMPRFWQVLQNQIWFLVPIFFVLSGFLITRILLRTRDREGYFRVFYTRRALRILPLYYLVVVGVTIYTILWQRSTLHPLDFLYYIYLQNFTGGNIGTTFILGHFWSLAVEEQFYLVWPLAIWLLRSERAVLYFSYAVVIASAIFRFAWPWIWHVPIGYSYIFTPTRVDGILLGAILAIHYEHTKHWERFAWAARIGIPLLLAGTLAVTLVKGYSFPANDITTSNYLGLVYCIPAMNFIGAGFVILALTPGSYVARACSRPTICKIGSLSYALYVFHDLYLNYIYVRTMPRLARHMPEAVAHVVFTVFCFGLTMALALASYWLLEKPALRLKEKFPYGSVVKRPAPFGWFGRARPTTDAGE